MSTIPNPTEGIEPKPWQTGLAPVLIGVFLWVAFFDQIGGRALPTGGLSGSLLGVVVGGPLAYLCLFRSSAVWGHRSNRGLDDLSAVTFGVSGAKVVPGLLIPLAQVVLFGVGVGYAVELTFQGLILAGFVDARAILPGQPGGIIARSPLYLATALFWAVATALVSLKFTRWIGYLMQFFPIFPAALLGLAMVATLGGLRTFRPLGSGQPSFESGRLAFLITLQWVFAFASLPGVMGADWGLGSRDERDVKLGGWVGMAFAPLIVAILALIAVAGAQGAKDGPRILEGSPTFRGQGPSPVVIGGGSTSGSPIASSPGIIASPPYTFRAVVTGTFPNRLGALILVVFGLGSLAPAVYASFVFGLRFKGLAPRISRLSWTMVGTVAAWLLVVVGWFDRTEVIFDLIGAAFAPVAGAFAADFRRQKGGWPGPRARINPAGLMAWGVGLAVGLIPTVGATLGSESLSDLRPASLMAFVAAFLTYEILAILRCESHHVDSVS